MKMGLFEKITFFPTDPLLSKVKMKETMKLQYDVMDHMPHV